MKQRETVAPLGGILCDEMGLGKTIETLGLIKNDKSKTLTLLIAPVAVLGQWEEKARESGITIMVPEKTGKTVRWKAQGKFLVNAPSLYLIGYEMARSKHELVTSMAWDRVVCDEAHRVASGKALKALVERIHAKTKWFLTGTPIVNRIQDFTNLLELIGVTDMRGADFETIVHTYVLARSMDDLRSSIKSAPPKPVYHTVSLPFITQEEGEFFRGMSGIIVKRWKALDSESGSNAFMKLKLFMHLRQLSMHPQVYIEARRKVLGPLGYTREDWIGSSTKFEAIRSLIQKEKAKKHKWIIFCHFHKEMELLKTALEVEPHVRNIHVYNGTLSYGERTDVLNATKALFLNDSAKTVDILLIQLQSGGVGLNLQHFDRIIFSGPWWTSALMEQAVGRAVRIGQSAVVNVYHLQLKEEEGINIDAVMMNKAKEKGELCRGILKMACRDH